jgi:competence protein ComEA
MIRKSNLIALVALVVLSLTTPMFAADAAAPAAAPAGVVNINSADVAQLSLLPRVGEKAAQRIVDYRKEHGNFKKTSDLMQVKGFGAK